MKTKIILAFSALILFTTCSNEKEESTIDEEVIKTVNVRTSTVVPQNFDSFLKVVGIVETSDDIMISAEVSGRVTKYYVQEGEKVKTGEIILKIDDAKLNQEKARLEAITAQARENYERLKKIYEEDGIGSEIDYLNAKYAYEQNTSSLASLKIDISNTKIKAPFNGIVEEIMYEVGEVVNAGAPTVRLIGSQNYTITAGVPARYASSIKKGDDVRVWFDTQNSDTLTKQVSFVGNAINPQNRTFRIEIDVEESERLKVDMISNIQLKTMERNEVIIVSEEFIYSKDGNFIVYVLSKDEKGKAVAKEKVVLLGASYKSNVIVEAGLEPGEELITIGSAFLNNGMRLNVVEEKNQIAAQ